MDKRPSPNLLPSETERAAMLPRNPGPAMKALSQRQQVFVVAAVSMGDLVNYTEAARIAGYSINCATSVQAWRLSHDPRIKAAITEVTSDQEGTLAHQALRVLEVLAGDATKPRPDLVQEVTSLAQRLAKSARGVVGCVRDFEAATQCANEPSHNIALWDRLAACECA